MSAIAADLFPSKPRSWGWLIPIILGLIMAMGMLVSKTKTGGESFTCDQTFSNSTGLATAIGNAANNTTICLNNADYGSISLTDLSRTGFVTIRSVNALGAQMSPQVSNTDNVKFIDMTLTDMLVSNCSTHIHIIDSKFVAGVSGLYFTGTGSCTDGQDLLVDGTDFRGVYHYGYPSGPEGALSTESDIDGLIIRYSQFGADTYGDGIQIGGGTSTGIDIGPGNVFDDLTQSYCDSVASPAAHCDAIQIFAGTTGGAHIHGNKFTNTTTHIMAPDGSADMLVEDNIHDQCGTEDYFAPVQIGDNTWSQSGAIFRHNTVMCADSPSINGSNSLVENNLILNGEIDVPSGAGSCTGCTIRYNLFDISGNQSGTNVVIGDPVWIGATWPSRPSTWAGYQMSGGSPGENAGNDGQDMGTRYYGT